MREKLTTKIFFYKVSDPYLQTEAASSCIEKILNGFTNREAEVTKEWENWNLKHEIEGILQEIIMANQEVNFKMLFLFDI